MYKDFGELVKKAKAAKPMKKMAVAAALDDHVLAAVCRAYRDGIVDPLLFGQKEEIEKILSTLDMPLPEEQIIDAQTPEAAAFLAVQAVRNGSAKFLMKGILDTSVMLKAVLNKETGIETGGVISCIGMFSLPCYKKIFGLSDGAVIMFPDLNTKIQIIKNAIQVFSQMGYERIKIAALSSVEKVNPKMPDTLDAQALKEMCQKGELGNCILDGPISYDLVFDEEAARIKKYESAVTGDADFLLMPDIISGNILSKALRLHANAELAGVIVGAKCPIVLTSRGTSVESKYLSIAVVSQMAG
jgi:phosphate butyryltransferase